MKWLKRLLRAAVGLVLTLAALAILGGAWLLGTESGLRWALGFAPDELTVEAPRGALAGTVSFERLAYEGNEVRNASFDLNLLALFADTLSVDFLRAESITLQRPQKRSESKPLPFRVKVSDAEVRSLVFEGYEIHDLRAEYSGSASGHKVEASFSAAGASALVKASVQEEIVVEADVRRLNLAVIDPSLPETALALKLEGRGTASAFAGKATASNPAPGAIDRQRLPFRTVNAAFSTDFKMLDLQSMRVALHPAGSIEGKGKASLDGGAFDIRVAALDLRGLWSTLRSTRLSGPLQLDLARERQRIKGTLAQDDMSLAADAERRGDDIEVRALHARAGDSEAIGSGRLRLGEPLRFAADLKLSRFNPARFGDYPEGGINGTVQAKGDLGGSGSARWDVANSTLLGQKLASKGSARLAGTRVVDADAWATLGENRATAKGSFGGPRDSAAWTLHVPDLATLAEGFGGEVRASGTARGTWTQPNVALEAQAKQLRLAEGLLFAQAGLKAAGTLEKHAGELAAKGSDLDLAGSVRGGWRNGAWRGEILSLRNQGAYPLELKTPATLEAGKQRVALGRFEAEVAGGRATVESVRWQEGRLTSDGRVRGFPAQWILTARKVDQLSGDLALDGEWAIASTPKLNGRVAVRRARGDLLFGGTPLELSAAELTARLTDDAVEAFGQVNARLASAKIEGKASGFAPESKIDFSAELRAAELRALTEPLWTQARVQGRLSATLKAGGTLGAPLLSGTLRGDDLALDMVPWGIALREGRLRAELDANRLRITDARIHGGDGVFRATGSMPLALTSTPDGAATLEWEARRFRVMGRPDRRLEVSGKGVTSFDGKRFGLIGQLRAESGNFELADESLPQLANDVEIVGRKDEELRVSQRKQGPLPLDLDLRADLGSNLHVRAYGFDGNLTGQVHVTTGPLGYLFAKGRVEAVRARFEAYGQELDVDPGALIFDGPLDSPGLDISAWRRHQAVEAGLRLTGTVQAPRVELISNPPVGESEKLSWLVLGRAPTDASGADLALLQAAGGAMLGRGGGVPFQRRFAQKLGFDELTVRGSSELASNVVALGKRYSDRLYFSFEQAIGATTEYLVKLDYALTRRVSLRGQTGTTSGAGIFYRYSWD